MDMNIGVGKYSLTTAIHSSFDHLEECVHWVDNACEFEIAGVKGNLFIGICRLEPRIELRRV
jgi:lipopolysaccharide transport system ATP-binding protein